MTIDRRQLLAGMAGVLGAAPFAAGSPAARPAATRVELTIRGSRVPRTFSITPVVYDGKWNWKEQPLDQKGYLDPREFDVRAGIRWRSDGQTRNLKGSTLVPCAFPEQEVLNWQIEKPEGCEARVQPLSDTAAQLQMAAPGIRPGETITVAVVARVRLFRFCPHYSADQFADGQEYPQAIRDHYLGNSPGIRCEMPGVRELVKSITSRHDPPWQRARRFFDWAWDNIEGLPGKYTSVQAAIRNGRGDCEERAGVFVALCRANGIPARLVLVPNHCWAEFCLINQDGEACWIPAHTAAYNWFGWTGTHELVLQKGDRIDQPGKDKTVRLVEDWYQFQGRRPIIEYFGELVPVEGPGQRVRNRQGGWDLAGEHPENRFFRD